MEIRTKNINLRILISKVNLIYFLGLTTFLLQINLYYGEDIVNARNNYLSGEKTDFWGGISTFVYAHIPSFGVRWQIWLAFFQITMSSIALNKIIYLKHLSFRLKLIAILVLYSALIFSSQMTRDGLMFSLMILGFALLIECSREKSTLGYLWLSTIIIILALSFRPWVSSAILPVLLIFLKKVKVKSPKLVHSLIICSVITLPLANDLLISKALGLKKAYPEQMVMLTDIATSYCYSNNFETGERAKIALDLFSPRKSLSDNACQLYRPDTWISLTKTSKVTTENVNIDFELIQPTQSSKYQKLKSDWIQLVIKDPVTYLQNKILFAGKLIVGSDSRNLSLLSAGTIFQKMTALFRFVYEFAISCHLYSVIAVFFYLLIFPIVRYKKAVNQGLQLDQLTVNLFFTLILWIILSSIAYVGSNGRYTYSITLLSLMLLVREFTLRNSSLRSPIPR